MVCTRVGKIHTTISPAASNSQVANKRVSETDATFVGPDHDPAVPSPMSSEPRVHRSDNLGSSFIAICWWRVGAGRRPVLEYDLVARSLDLSKRHGNLEQGWG